jgi:hypothetical protein
MVLGSSTHAFELMLSAFILGLAIGGFTIRNRMEYIVNHLKILAWVQIIMGVMAFLTLLTYGRQFHLMNFFYHGLGKTPQGYILFNIISHGIAMSIMLPATICAGMTLPLITHYLLTKGEGERVIGKVYALNTFGSITGVIIGVQFILPNMGLRHLITIGGGIDILLGVVLLFSAGSVIVGQKTRILTAALSFFILILKKWLQAYSGSATLTTIAKYSFTKTEKQQPSALIFRIKMSFHLPQTGNQMPV